ncbi:hypothetical protein KFL_004390050 [Klebsormidium nitens]|uniref:Uncharacterized protein n=1 Tax=Klebsormidium nitens TaxID=105231 RepID=A0A1Y1IIS6_KLENI|nr:hypothetical protein KFL_004390050 [Klebsormidium nitens]|eukprot:GAQ88557.1 hypothetical protein KFL_004390050 [Klebsormidium nitens]
MDKADSLQTTVPGFSPVIRKRGSNQKTTMQATGTSSKERTDSIASTQEEAASRLGVGGADFLNDPDKERGRQLVPEDVHPSVQLLIDVLKEEMPKFFSENGITTTMYREDVHFQDPQNNWHRLIGFKLNVWVLRLVFAGGKYLLHDIKATGENEITARWTFDLPARFWPWTPTVILTGITKYGVDLKNAKLNAHIDYWDNLAGKEQKPVSLAAISSVIKQLQPMTAFNIPRDEPHEVIRKTKYYEIRRYAMDLTDSSSQGEEWIAVERAKGTLLRALKKDGIELKSEKEEVRRLDSSWPHKKIEEIYVPVSYTPSVYDPVDFTGAESWRM